MPLPATSAPRKLVHTRRVDIQCWYREDGLLDMEACMVDLKEKDYPLPPSLDVRLKGQPLHDMRVRLTIDQEMTIHDVVVSSDAVPYPGGCDTIAPVYQQLIGLSLMKGFRRAVMERFGGVRGCSHITELLGALPTAAFQTMASVQREKGVVDWDDRIDTQPAQLDHCHALEISTETVRQFYPRWYRAPKEEAPEKGAYDGSTTDGGIQAKV
ncbi:MAG: DUF2889 domain-containing protein [Rugosibacter sp.]|jgi:hypothetical protein|nr:hypothetical protein [Rugosibacter sp.]